MASLITKYGLRYLFRAGFRQEGLAEFRLALVTAAVTPDADTEDFSELTEIAGGNGYSPGGIYLAANDVDFETLAVVSGNLELTLRDILMEAIGGDIPASGDPIAHAVLLDDLEKVLIAWGFASTWTVPSGQQRVMNELLSRLSPPA